MSLSPEQIKKFNEDGFLLIDNYFTAEECDLLIQECRKIVDEMNPEEHNTVFTTLEMKRGDSTYCHLEEALFAEAIAEADNAFRETSDDYFLNSGDKIRFFFEDGAKDESGKLKVDKQLSLNKIGHALHILNPSFRKITFDERIKGIAKSLELVEPVICQSMYIFKQPGIGGEVVPHQDSTFLNTQPMKLFGIWIALEDALIDNGCLWFYPGSHKGGLYGNYRMVRNPKFGEDKEPSCIFTASPNKYDNDKFKPVEVKKGGAVLIHGEVVHKSERNTSTKSRNIYTFHMFDKNKTVYSEENWLQETNEVPFTPVYTTNPQ